MRTLSLLATLIACLACSPAMRNSEAAESKTEKEKLFVLSEHQGPVIGPDHPDELPKP